jgi:hypothetical protein
VIAVLAKERDVVAVLAMEIVDVPVCMFMRAVKLPIDITALEYSYVSLRQIRLAVLTTCSC